MLSRHAHMMSNDTPLYPEFCIDLYDLVRNVRANRTMALQRSLYGDYNGAHVVRSMATRVHLYAFLVFFFLHEND
jgi:hypothetical protein